MYTDNPKPESQVHLNLAVPRGHIYPCIIYTCQPYPEAMLVKPLCAWGSARILQISCRHISATKRQILIFLR